MLYKIASVSHIYIYKWLQTFYYKHIPFRIQGAVSFDKIHEKKRITREQKKIKEKKTRHTHTENARRIKFIETI